MCLWNARAGKNARPRQQCKETAWLLGSRHTHSSRSSQSRGMIYEKDLCDCPHAKFSKIILPYTRNGSPLAEGRTNSRLRPSWLADFALSRSDLELFRKVLNENQPLGGTNQLCHGVIRSLFSAEKQLMWLASPLSMIRRRNLVPRVRVFIPSQFLCSPKSSLCPIAMW
ncbi:uncharacterized protein P174DRAFT_200686 [Aspergillus novofumigatus IBT 16806]|uniref:Uncharacterized protein n=1 Tax=Aspergillus novofumigatus (strain IBT 16806) TaxID=1392255 RepID=A0A2I1C4C8_ASPN1|nr:uncharacterized protein P174DRAFT_200686 [Aspergillus novofumigatus IBT 16806]PKX92468.1 hypothetical protein P174DRAFT_200686 [Aspergillus novofumigatus IBT 16806]